jgi:hypothetical protein
MNSTTQTNLTWLALLALTCGSYWLSELEAQPVALFAIALLKLFLITAVFMELKHCRPLLIRSAMSLYLLTLSLIVITSA